MSYYSTIAGLSGTSLVGYYKCDEASGAVANNSHSSGVNAAIVGTVARNNYGMVPSSAKSFGLTSGVNGGLVKPGRMAWASGFSLVMNIRFNDDATLRQCVMFNGGGTGGTGLILNGGGGSANAHLWWLEQGVAWGDAGIAITEGQNYNLIFTWNGSNNLVRIYLDGNEVFSGFKGVPSDIGTDFLKIGCEGDDGSNAITGDIDEVFVLTGSIDPTDIAAVYAASSDPTVDGAGGPPAGVIQTASSGNSNVGATWVGGVVPSTGDEIEILDGHTLSVVSNLTVKTGTIRGSGRIVFPVEDITLTCTDTSKPFLIEGHASNSARRMSLAAGCKFVATPGSGNTFDLRMGNGTGLWASIEARGTQAKPCRIGLASGDPGTFTISNVSGQTWNRGLLDCEWTHLELGGPAVAGSRSVNFELRYDHPLRLIDCTVNTRGTFYYSPFSTGDSGKTDPVVNLTRTKFTHLSGLQGEAFQLEAYYGSTPGIISNCWFKGILICNYIGGGTVGMLTRQDNIYESGVAGQWPQASLTDNGSFLYQSEQVSSGGEMAGAGTWNDPYFFSKIGNPHCFYGGSKKVVRAIWDQGVAWSVDTGDSFDFNGADSEVWNSIILPNAKTAGKTSGTIWWLGGTNQLRLFHNTLYCPEDITGLSYSHSAAMSAGRVPEVKSNLFYGPGSGYGIFNETPEVTDVDAVTPAGITNNAFVGLQSGTCTVNGVDTSIPGIKGAKFSVLPSGNIVLGVGEADLVDDTRNFLKWCRDVRGFTGTDAEVVDSGVAYVYANPGTVSSDLGPWVRQGFQPQNATLSDAGHDGETIGAASFGAVEPPLPWHEWPTSLSEMEAKVQDAQWGPARAQEMIDAWALYQSGGGDDNTFAITYYDASRVWLQISKYFETINPTFSAKALEAASAAGNLYLNGYLIRGSANYDATGFWNFTTGFRMLYETTGDPKWKTAVINLSTNAAYATDSPYVDVHLIDRAREVAYAVIAHKNAKRLGAPYRQAWDDRIADLKQHTQWVVDGTEFTQVFMQALMAEALTYVYYDSVDLEERAWIVDAVSQMCDEAWETRWDPPAGWFTYGVDDSWDLNNLVAPMYAWAWHKTGLARHRDRFDTIFSLGVLGGWFGPQKQFNQQNKWIYPAIVWRSEPVYLGLDDQEDPTGEEPDNSVTDYAFVNVGVSSVTVGSSVGPLRITLGTGVLDNPVLFTFSVSGPGGSLSPATRTLTDASRLASVSYVPSVAGEHTISVTNNGGLVNPAPITITAVPLVDSDSPPLIPVGVPEGTQFPVIMVGSRVSWIIPWDGKP